MSKELYAQSSLHRMVRYDARAEILSSLGDLSDIHLWGNQIIIAPYVQSGILWNEKLGFPLLERLSVDTLCDLYQSGKGFRASSFSKELIWQGKVALVVKSGAEVEKAKVGEWIFTLQENTRGVSLQGKGWKKSRVLKALDIDYDGWPCRFVYETDIYGDLLDPDMLV